MHRPIAVAFIRKILSLGLRYNFVGANREGQLIKITNQKN